MSLFGWRGMAEYIIEENDVGRRVDRVVRHFLKKRLNHSSLSSIYSYFRKGLVRLNGKKVSPATLTALKDVLYIYDSIFKDLDISNGKNAKQQVQVLDREKIYDSIFKDVDTSNGKNAKQQAHGKNEKNILQSKDRKKIELLLKTDDLLFINKPSGLATHGRLSVDEIVKERFSPLAPSLSFVVGSLHRLDKNTTGALAFSQSLKGAREFSKAIKDGNIFRYYIGINEGFVKDRIWKVKHQEIGEKPKEEITQVSLIEYSKKEKLSLVCYRLFTGKKHQIRKGAADFATPLFCDVKYGSKRKDYQTYFLHAFAIHFKEPLFPDIPGDVIAPLFPNFMLAITKYFPKTAQNLHSFGYSSFFKQLLNFF